MPSAPSYHVCFSGSAKSVASDRGESIRAHLLAPLRAAASAALTYTPSAVGCAPTAPCSAPRLDVAFPVTVEWEAETSIAFLYRLFARAPHWSRVVRAYNATGRCTRQGSMRLRCDHVFLGNSVFSPLIGSTNVLRQLYTLRRCARMPSTQQASHLVHSRLDFRWLAPHPDPPIDAIFVPTGEDYYGGLNDRHAVVPRAHVRAYMHRFDALLDGRIMELDPQLRRGVVRNGLTTQDEVFLRNVLRDVPVRRFPSVAFLECCRLGGACFSRRCYRRRYANATHPLTGKYASELEAAIRHATMRTI